MGEGEFARARLRFGRVRKLLRTLSPPFLTPVNASSLASLGSSRRSTRRRSLSRTSTRSAGTSTVAAWGWMSRGATGTRSAKGSSATRRSAARRKRRRRVGRGRREMGRRGMRGMRGMMSFKKKTSTHTTYNTGLAFNLGYCSAREELNHTTSEKRGKKGCRADFNIHNGRDPNPPCACQPHDSYHNLELPRSHSR